MMAFKIIVAVYAAEDLVGTLAVLQVAAHWQQ
nr:hypothetical protein CPGR_00795 [Mycolicibacterium malmesburyense]